MLYDPKSHKAEEFINHEEVLASLDYAEKNKHNVELIDQIIAKAKLRKGLSHREAAVLLDCDIEEKNQEIYALAEQIKKDSTDKTDITFEDIMGIEHKIKAEEVWKLTDPVMEKITTDVAAKIKELNGDKTVAATFVVGGGGKIHGFCEALARKLSVP